MANIYRAREAFASPVGGHVQVFPAGHLVTDEDPLFQSHRGLFTPLDEVLERTKNTVESATAAPGERRSVRLPRPASQKENPDAAPAAP